MENKIIEFDSLKVQYIKQIKESYKCDTKTAVKKIKEISMITKSIYSQMDNKGGHRNVK